MVFSFTSNVASELINPLILVKILTEIKLLEKNLPVIVCQELDDVFKKITFLIKPLHYHSL